MKKVAAFILILFLFNLFPAQTQKEEFPAGKELSILHNEMITEYRATMQDFIFEHKLSARESPEEMLIILEEKADELTEEITDEVFAVEMRRLATEVSVITQSMNILGEKISEIIKTLPEELHERMYALIERFNQMAILISELGSDICQEIGENGHKPTKVAKITESRGNTGSSKESGPPDDSGSSKESGPPKEPGPKSDSTDSGPS
ncbi:MAG: hypothetical protein HXS54_11855 [Theionarchaea archaeon]|nr:hypothetical protein [Theionarchaea archaeon]